MFGIMKKIAAAIRGVIGKLAFTSDAEKRPFQGIPVNVLEWS